VSVYSGKNRNFPGSLTVSYEPSCFPENKLNQLTLRITFPHCHNSDVVLQLTGRMHLIMQPCFKPVYVGKCMQRKNLKFTLTDPCMLFQITMHLLLCATLLKPHCYTINPNIHLCPKSKTVYSMIRFCSCHNPDLIQKLTTPWKDAQNLELLTKLTKKTRKRPHNP
jgi:hypothetical protein